MTGDRVIRVSAVAFVRDRADAPGPEILTVRKRGTDLYQFPGGKPEPGEDPVDTAVREVGEETGVTLPARALRPVGSFTAPAANESGHTVVAEVYTVDWDGGTPTVAAEIAEAHWTPLGTSGRTPEDPGFPLAPLMFRVFPAIATVRSGLH